MSTTPVGYGLVGAGGFGRFCVEAYRGLDAVRCVSVADVNRAAATQAADDLGLEACDSIDALLDRDDVQLVHLATPPSTHAELAMRCLEAGKHVLSEKPLATSLADAERMIALAQSRGLLLAVNLIMRYNPLIEAVKAILDAGFVGTPLRATFENLAKDQTLPADHWFWNRELSGGIFIEHGVHFFDLFAYLLGDDQPTGLMSAHQVVRPGSDDLVDQVQATVCYGQTLASFYHGFAQATAMDRQTMRFVGTRGDILLDEWVPTTMRVDVLTTEARAEEIAALVPHSELQRLPVVEDDLKPTPSARGEAFEADGRYIIKGNVGMPKSQLYQHVLRTLLADQIAAIHDASHARRVSEANGFKSLELAVQATEAAA